MGICLEIEVAESKQGTYLEMIGTRQAHYIKRCEVKGIFDPARPHSGWESLVVIYLKYVMLGVNYQNKHTMQSATCQGYAAAVRGLL